MNRNKNNNMLKVSFPYFILLIVVIGTLFFFNIAGNEVHDLTTGEFMTAIDKEEVVELTITPKSSDSVYYLEGKLEGYNEHESFKTKIIPEDVEKISEYATNHNMNLYDTKKDPGSSSILYIIVNLLPIVILAAVTFVLFNKMAGGNKNSMDFGRSRAKLSQDGGKVRFKDVAGLKEEKEEVAELIDFLKNPKKFQKLGARIPKGVLLVGPPGTGKTLLAKAVAGEAGVPFFSISGSEFVEMFVGRGAAKVRDLFKQAREKAPCIVFIDEIDTIGKKRDGAGMNGNDEREQTLNQLLAEMDGFDGSKGVVLLAATNRPDSLDPALTRPGRFDRRIPVELPDLAGREAILKLHAKDIKCSNNIDFNVIARASAGASGAELANIINEGALLAVRDHRKTVVQKDLEEAIEIVIAGEQKKGAVISNRERMIVSYHEIGHALVAAKCKNTAPVHKITIIPRTKGALGYTMQVEENEQNLLSKEEAFQKIMVYTGGRCAEELIFNSITSGASNDIEQATKLARAMITRLGMSDEFGMTALETVNNQYLGGDTSLACSNETATKIDEATIALIKKAHDEAYQILEDNKMKLHELAKFLYERETITGEEFMYILNKPAEISTKETY